MKKYIGKFARILAIGLLPFSAMAQEHDHSKMDMDHKTPEAKSHQAGAEFQGQLNNVFKATVNLNEAFMTEDSKEVKSAAENVKNSIGQVDMQLLSGSAHMDWMKYLKVMNDGLNRIIETTVISQQRMDFTEFNTGLYQSIKAFGIGQQAFYQYCPMANSNAGAYWLSGVEEIRNPYMGSKMPKCGSVKETLN